MKAIEITKENFEEVLNKNEIVIFDFWAPWCGPCKMFGPIFEKVAEKYPQIVFGKINTEVEQELAGAFQIRSIPTLMIFREKVVLLNQAGMVPEKALEDLIEQVKKLDMKQIHADIAKDAQTA